MSVEGLLAADAVLCDLKATSKKHLLQELASHAASVISLDERLVFDALLERERLGATSVGNGVAIPHARLPDIDTVYGIFTRLAQPIDYDAADDEPVDLVFLLLAPESANNQHLRALAKISRLLKRPEIRASLRGADGAEALYSMLIEDHRKAA